MPQRQNLHRQIRLDEPEPDRRTTDASADETVDELIAKFLRAIQKLKEINGAS